MIQPYYQDNLVTLYHGKQEDVLPKLDIKVDCVLTDPPYGLTNLDWDIVPDLLLMWQNLRRVSKSNAVMALFCQQPFTTDLIMSNRKAWRYEWIWPKNNPVGFLSAGNRPLRSHEHVQIFVNEFKGSLYNPQKTIGEPYKKKRGVNDYTTGHYGSKMKLNEIENDGYRFPTSIMPSFSIIHKDSTHETPKPIALLEYLILTYTNTGDLIIDPFIGSGSTAVAAAKIGRRCIGIEMREEALEVAVKRLSQLPLAILNY